MTTSLPARSAPRDKVPGQVTLYTTRTRRGASLCLRRRCQPHAGPIFLWESGVTSPSCHYQACLPQPESTRVALCGVVSASLRPWLIYRHLSHLSRVGCGVLGHLRNQGGQHTTPHNHGVEKR